MMARNWELTPNQQDQWEERMRLLWAGRPSNLALAGGDKTFSGYMGEFRLGRPRALVYFFETPSRLRRLARLLDTRPEVFQTILDEIRASTRPSAGHLLVPGFEDWGWLPLEAVFHQKDDGPPPRSRQEKLKSLRRGKSVRQILIQAIKDGGVTAVVSQPGWGVHTLVAAALDAVARDHWRSVTGPLNEGDRLVKVVNLGAPLPPESKTWAKKKTRSVLWLVDARRPRPGGLSQRSVQLVTVDGPWCQGFRSRVLDLAPARWKKRLKSVNPEAFVRAVMAWRSPGPLLAGCVLRALATGQEIDGPALVEAMLIRRAEAQGRGDLAQVLAGTASSLPALRCELLRPTEERDLGGCLDSEAMREAMHVIDGLRLRRRERQTLLKVLPEISGTRILQALRNLEVLGDGEGARLKGATLLEPAAAAAVRGDQRLLQMALVKREHTLLRCVVERDGGADVIQALGSLDDVGFAAALGPRSEVASWIGQVSLPSALTARALGLMVATRSLKNLRISGVALGALGSLANVQLTGSEIPTVEQIRAQALRFIQLTNGSTDHLETRCRMLRCLAFNTSEELGDDQIWQTALQLDWDIPDAWIQHRLCTDAGALSLSALDRPLGRALGTLLLKETNHRHSKRTENANARIWSKALDALATRSPEAAIELLQSTLEVMVERAAACPPREPTQRWRTSEENNKAGEAFALLRLIVHGLECPALARKRSALRAALRGAMRGFTKLQERDDFPLEPWGRGKPSLYPFVLRHLLAFLYNPDELAVLLLTPDGRLGPFWLDAAEAGASITALRSVYLGVRTGTIGTVPGRGAPDARTNELRARDGLEPMRPETDLYEVLVCRLTADEIALLPDAPVPGRDAPPGYRGESLLNPEVRAFTWRFHRTLNAEDVVWELLRAPHFEEPKHPLLDRPVVNDRPAQRERDRPWVEAAIRASGAPSKPSDWNLLARAALASAVSDESLIHLLERFQHWELETFLQHGQVGFMTRGLQGASDVFNALVERNPTRAREWLVSILQERPGWIDQRPTSSWLRSAGVRLEFVESALHRCAESGPCGRGLLSALRDLGGELGPWLLRPATQAAALTLLAGETTDEEQLVETLRRLDSLLPDDALRGLLQARRTRGIDLLVQVCEDWPGERRRELWAAVGRVSWMPWQRQEAWRRAALCRLSSRS